MNIGRQRAKNGLRGGGACLLPLAILRAPVAAMDHPPATPFVRTSGTAFTVDGGRFDVTGVNNYYLTFASQGAVTRMLDDAVAMGANVVRTFLQLNARPLRPARRAGAIIAGFVLTAFAYTRTRFGAAAEAHTRQLFSRLRRESA